MISFFLVQVFLVTQGAQAAVTNTYTLDVPAVYGSSTLAPQLMIDAGSMRQFMSDSVREGSFVEFDPVLDRLMQKAKILSDPRTYTGRPLAEAFSHFPRTVEGLSDFFLTENVQYAKTIDSFLKKADRFGAYKDMAKAAFIYVLGMLDFETQEEKRVLREVIRPFLSSNDFYEQLCANYVLYKIGTADEQVEAVEKILAVALGQDFRYLSVGTPAHLALELLSQCDIPQTLRAEVLEKIMKSSMRDHTLSRQYYILILRKTGIAKTWMTFYLATEFLFNFIMSQETKPADFIPVLELFAQEANSNKKFKKMVLEDFESISLDIYRTDSLIKYLIFLSNLTPDKQVISALERLYSLDHIHEYPLGVKVFADAVRIHFFKQLWQKPVSPRIYRPVAFLRDKLKDRKTNSLLKQMRKMGYSSMDISRINESLIREFNKENSDLKYLAFYALEKLYAVDKHVINNRDLAKASNQALAPDSENYFYSYVPESLIFDTKFHSILGERLPERILSRGFASLENVHQTMSIVSNIEQAADTLLNGFDDVAAYKNVFADTVAFLIALLKDSNYRKKVKANFMNLGRAADVVNVFVNPLTEEHLNSLLDSTTGRGREYIRAAMLTALPDEFVKLKNGRAFVRQIIEPYHSSKSEVLQMAAFYVLNRIGSHQEGVESIQNIVRLMYEVLGSQRISWPSVQLGLQLLAECDMRYVPETVKAEIAGKIASLHCMERTIYHKYCPAILENTGLTPEIVQRYYVENDFIAKSLATNNIIDRIETIEFLARHAHEFPQLMNALKKVGENKLNLGHLLALGNMQPSKEVFEELEEYLLSGDKRYEIVAYAFLARFHNDLSGAAGHDRERNRGMQTFIKTLLKGVGQKKITKKIIKGVGIFDSFFLPGEDLMSHPSTEDLVTDIAEWGYYYLRNLDSASLRRKALGRLFPAIKKGNKFNFGLYIYCVQKLGFGAWEKDDILGFLEDITNIQVHDAEQSAFVTKLILRFPVSNSQRLKFGKKLLGNRTFYIPMLEELFKGLSALDIYDEELLNDLTTDFKEIPLAYAKTRLLLELLLADIVQRHDESGLRKQWIQWAEAMPEHAIGSPLEVLSAALTITSLKTRITACKEAFDAIDRDLTVLEDEDKQFKNTLTSLKAIYYPKAIAQSI